jgi:outer membrane protein assembly factor BamB
MLARPASAAEKDAVSAQAIPGGVADANGKRGYLVNADRQIDAVDLESGKVLWTFKDGGRPLAVVGDRLLVQVVDAKKPHAARVLLLDADGKNVLESDPLEFPDWVTPGPTGRWSGRSFAAQPRVEKGELWLKWKASARYSGGAAPTPEILKAAMKDADGAARVNLESGKVEMLASDKAPAAAEGPKVSDELKKLAGRQVFNGSEMEMQVTTVGDNAVAVDIDSADKDRQQVVLKRWDLKTGKALDPVKLAEGGAYMNIPAPSAGMVLVRNVVAKPEADDAAWVVYSLETGKETARFAFEQGTADATVLGPRAYYVVQGQGKGPGVGGLPFALPRTLRAVDLKTGKRIWERPLEGVDNTPPPP